MFKCIKKCYVDRIYFEGEIVNADMSKNTNFLNMSPTQGKVKVQKQETNVIIEETNVIIEETVLTELVIEDGVLKKKAIATN